MIEILRASFKGALIKFFKLIFFAIIILIVLYVVGLLSNKPAKALVAKDLISHVPAGGTTKDGNVNSGQGDINFSFDYAGNNDTIPSNGHSLVALHINRFAINFTEDPTYSDCSGTLNASNYANLGSAYNANISWSCPNSHNGYELSQSTFYSFYAIVKYHSNWGYCWTSADNEGMLLCPFAGTNEPIESIEIHINYKSPYAFNYSFHTSRFMEYFDYESTDIINSQGQIVNQQTITNNFITDNSTSGSETSANNALSDVQQTFQTKLSGMNELTQAVFAPINAMLSVGSSTCTPLVWDIPFVNVQATIPCMGTIYNGFFSTVITLFAMIITGIYAYRSIIRIVSTIKDLLDVENDKIEVIDL